MENQEKTERGKILSQIKQEIEEEGGDVSPQEPNPLWMPQGSVRAIITLSLLVMSGVMLTMGTDIPEWLSILVVSCVSFYFGTRKTTAKPE